jgi:lauroyl/myristoyl acyltransferase
MSIPAAGLRLVRALPFWLACATSRFLVITYLLLNPRARHEIARNHARLFGRTDPGFWFRHAVRLGGNIALMAKTGQPALDNQLDNALIDGQNILERIMLGNSKAVVLSLHYGVWELLPHVFARKGYPVCVGMGSQQDIQLGRELGQLRTGQRVTFTNRVAEMRQALEQKALVGFALDNTRASRGVRCDALWPGFSLLRTPFALAQAERAVLVPMLIRKAGPRLSVKVGEPVKTPDEFGAWARQEILAYPEEWVFWGKREVCA